ncbi:Rac GTPase-activating protein BCR/ABR [Sporothrix curviconia]|uniref:Rac GTPase-activating protein BCR/ABR n=1 Tax=Sporothrix curviconia TaxID=1260050 RepID=A0ABP0BC53_9PEZI
MQASIHRFRLQRPEQPDAPSSSTAPAHRRRPAVPACDRCRRYKKKCSRTFPSCSLCVATGQGCSLATSAGSNDAQVHHLRARVAWLSQQVNASRPAGHVPVEAVPTGEPLPAGMPNKTTAVPLPHYTPPVASGQAAHTAPPPPPPPHLSVPEGHYTAAADASPGSPFSTLPPDGLARRLVDAYFRNVNRAYPFVDRAQVLRDLEKAADDACAPSSPDSPNAPSGANATLLYLIMAIGCTTLQRAGQIAPDVASKFHVDYAAIVQECFGFGHAESLVSVQILVLLALYSLFDPDGASTWSIGSIVGVVSRQAVLLGLSRRLSPDAAFMQQGPAVELRHRLFWSIYILDRMMAASLGVPVALVDDNMDVPLPALTIDEFAAPSLEERTRAASVLQTSRHVIQLRQLEDRILREVHTRRHSELRVLAAADRAAVLRELRYCIEDWYASGCLLAPLEMEGQPGAVPDNVPIHSSMAWLSARYYHLLLLLYYPSPFARLLSNTSVASTTGGVSRAELQRFAQKHLQATVSLHQHRQLPLNRITLCRLLPVGLVLMHCFLLADAETAAMGPSDAGHAFTAPDAVAILVSLAEAFPPAWSQAQQAAHILRRFQAVVAANVADDRAIMYDTTPYYVRQIAQAASYSLAGTSTRALMQPLLAAMTDLMQETLGPTSFYLFSEMEEERLPGKAERELEHEREREREHDAQLRQQQQAVAHPSVSSVLANDGVWGLELDFL